MNIGSITLALAVAAVAGSMTGELKAQEFTLPPTPSSPTEKGGTAFRAENGPCFYNAYSWMARGVLSQSLIAAEMQDLVASTGTGSGGCLGHYAVTGSDLYGPWAYMLSDGVPRPERVSQAKVKAVWEASRKAAAEAEAVRLGHVPVPRIGDGYGSDEIVGRTLVFRVQPRPTPATYNGIPIVERNRSWERFEAPDGRRVWRQIEPRGNSRQAGVRNGANGRASFRSSDPDRDIQQQEGLRSMQRSIQRSMPRFSDRSPGASSGSSSGSASSSSSETKSRTTPRGNKGREQ